jgi:hypothetical protein
LAYFGINAKRRPVNRASLRAGPMIAAGGILIHH